MLSVEGSLGAWAERRSKPRLPSLNGFEWMQQDE